MFAKAMNHAQRGASSFIVAPKSDIPNHRLLIKWIRPCLPGLNPSITCNLSILIIFTSFPFREQPVNADAEMLPDDALRKRIRHLLACEPHPDGGFRPVGDFSHLRNKLLSRSFLLFLLVIELVECFFFHYLTIFFM